MIDVGEIIRRYESGDVDKSKATSEIIGVDSGDFREPAEELSFELNQLGADLDWWMGNKTKTEAGIFQLGAEPSEVKVEEVLENYDIDYEVLVRLVEEKKSENMEEIKDRAGVEDMKEAAEEGGVRALFTEAMEQIGNIRNNSPNNKPLYVARLLKEMGEDEVSVDRYFKAHFLFDRILKAETARTFEGTLGEATGGML